MKTYFETKFEALVIDFGYEEALAKIIDILLFQSSTPSILKNKVNKFTDFWSSDFIVILPKRHLSNENFVFALGQYIRLSPSSIDACTLKALLKIDEESVINAIRLSGTIANPNHHSWHILNEIANQVESSRFDGFLDTVRYIQTQYQERINAYKDIKKQLQLDQITAMLFSSFYAYEYLMSDTDCVKIPYQMDTNDNVSVQDIWSVFHEIITSSNIEKNKLTEKKLGQTLKAKMSPFLFSENLNHSLMKQYEDFKRLVAHKIEINLYEDQVISAYCYKLSTNYYLENGQLKLETEAHDSDFFKEKFGVLSAYWQWRGVNTLTDNPHFERLDRGENLESNALALAKTQGIILQLYEVYGIEKAVFEQDYDLCALVFTMLLSQAHYVHDFLEAFKKLRDSNNQHAFSTLAKLMIDGVLIGQNRMPITFATQKEKAIKMSDWIIEGSGNQKVKDMSRILDFWSKDLRDGSDAFYTEKSFYKIDDYLFALPWMSAQKNFSTATINTFRKMYKNRASLRSETDLMENNLAGLLAKSKGRVYSQYEPSESGVGEIDAIVVSDDKVLIIELKSSYIKSNVKEIYEYRNFVLKKAAYQLARKTTYVRDIFLPSLGLDSAKFSIHSWIVDTTLEFDHGYIDGFLKISFEELLIVLDKHEMFITDMLTEDIAVKNNLDLATLIQNIESDNFWKTNLALIDPNSDFSQTFMMKN